MYANGTLHKGMYQILQDWYRFIEKSIHIQADLIGNFFSWNVSFIDCYKYFDVFLLQFIFEQVLKLYLNVWKRVRGLKKAAYR